MNILSALLGEHAVLKHQIELLRRSGPRMSDELLEGSARFLGSAVESHATIEDDLLFVPLEASGRMPAGPVAAMRREHEEIEALIGRFSAPREAAHGADGQLRSALVRLLETLLSHFAHEEHALFAIAARVLDGATLDELGARWASRRAVETGSVRALPTA